MLISNSPVFREAALILRQGGVCRPMAFAIQGITKTMMSNYSSMKLELLTLKWAVKEKFREYLQGNVFLICNRQKPCKLFADNEFGSYGTTIWTVASFYLEIEYRLAQSIVILRRCIASQTPSLSLLLSVASLSHRKWLTTTHRTNTTCQTHTMAEDEVSLMYSGRFTDQPNCRS